MVDPVIAADGHSYERKAIEAWLHQHSVSPVSQACAQAYYLEPRSEECDSHAVTTIACSNA